MLEAIEARGYEIHCVVYPEDDPSHIQGLKAKGWSCHTLNLSRKGLNPFKDFSYFLELRKLFKGLQPERVFTYTIKPVIFGAFALSASRRIKSASAMITGLGYAFMGTTIKQRLVERVVRVLYRFALRLYAVVIFQNKDDQELFEGLGLLKHTEKVIRVNGSGVSLEEFPLTPIPPTERIRFLMVARVLKAKGVYEYLEAAEQVTKAHPNKVEFAYLGPLDTGGDGIEESDFRRRCQKAHVQYLGESSDVRPHIAASHVMVLPSYREGLPRAVIEAMAMGRAVVTTDTPGCRETVLNGANGFLVPSQDSSALVEAMGNILSISRAELQTFGTQSRKQAENKFDVKCVNEQIIDVLLL
jgi:glycosyltransferase involved in cell wall biosynthesis